MAIPRELHRFVRDALAAERSRSGIEDVLTRAGWGREQVAAALGAFADAEFPIPVPRPQSQLSARDAFLYLVLFSTLFTAAFHAGSILFEFINHAFPDPAFPSVVPMDERIRFSVSALIVAFPVFVFVQRITKRDRNDPVRRNSSVRRWLTYLTLFVASGVLIGDTTGVIDAFLGGELTIRFALKAAVIGLIAGTIFAYYITDLGSDEGD